MEKKEKERKRQEKKEKKEREKREKQEKKEHEKLEKEQKERERKSQKEKEKEMKKQKSRERSKSSEKAKHKKEDKSALVFNETPEVNFSDKPNRSQTPTAARPLSRLERSPTPRGSPRTLPRSQLGLKDSPRISRSKSFQDKKRDKPKVGNSPSRSRSVRERDLMKSESDLVNSERSYGTLKDMPQSKKLKREKTAKFKHKQQDSKKRAKDRVRNRHGSMSVDDMRTLQQEGPHENRNRAYASDDSFVTARAESESNMGETSTVFDDNETGELGPPGTDVIKYNPETLTVELGDGQFDIELLEYPHMNSKDGGPISFVEDPFDYDDEEEDGKVTVPISICLILITGYILAGSVLFTLWEDWDLLTGSYFCFITLSTIGFGDIVPGTDMKEWESNEKLVLCALWLAFGLSLLAMCFNLMQEEVKEKCKWIGRKLGLLRNDEDG